MDLIQTQIFFIYTWSSTEWRKDVLSEKQNLVSFFAEYFQSREEDKNKQK